jgi:putative component of toxin-antitoxin plasmid stabilization module
MNIQEIKQAISELSPKELAQFRKWFEEFENQHANKESIEKRLTRLRGSLKGKGILKSYLSEKQRDKELFE